MKLSILILSVGCRIDNTYIKLIRQLEKQIGNRLDIEILALYDNRVLDVGEKRNHLLELAQGRYLTYIDDDDRISDDYISSIMEVIDKGKGEDCIVFDTMCHIHNKNLKVLCKYGIEYEYWWSDDKKNWRGKPAHTMVIKSSIGKEKTFRGSVGEDMDWVNRILPKLKTQARIDKVLYYYEKGIVPKPARRKRVENIMPIAKIIDKNKQKGICYERECK
ncbi:MAG: glycosyltransferase [Planctomycetota bacterium]|jgi:glycosyltransferase involved in cell wall biosynthesis